MVDSLEKYVVIATPQLCWGVAGQGKQNVALLIVFVRFDRLFLFVMKKKYCATVSEKAGERNFHLSQFLENFMTLVCQK